MWRWAYRRSAGERGQRVHAANNVAAAPLSRENREALSCSVKAQPSFGSGSASAMFPPSSTNRCGRRGGYRLDRLIKRYWIRGAGAVKMPFCSELHVNHLEGSAGYRA
jgi:hypothetical protein